MTPRALLFGRLCLALALVSTSRAAEPDPRLEGYKTPPGWKLAIAATEPLVVNPVTMTFGDDGRLYVAEWFAGRGPNDRIKVLTDKDGDGTFDDAQVYMDGLDLPAGIAFWDGWTYVTLDHDVVRFKDTDGDGKFETRQTIVTGFGNDDSHHRVSGITLGPDGWLYLTTGDSDAHAKGSDGSEATVLRCGGVFRCLPDGSHLETYAFGMRNPWGNVAFDDEFHMFHTDNDNEGTPGYTGCRLLHVVEGGDYGWRLREGARCCAPDFDRSTWNGGRPGRLGWVAETGRGAPAGLAVLNSSAFPPSTRNLLVYPDVFRKLVRAYQLKPSGTTYTVDREFELISSSDPLFRPDDAEVGPDGALYVLDWRTDSGGAGQLSGNGTTGRIYRLTWSGTPEEPARPTLPPDRFVKLRKATTAALGKALGSSDAQVRSLATLELIRRRPPPIDLHELLFARETSLAMALQSRLIHTALGVDLPISLWMPKGIDANKIQDVNRAIWIQKRLELIDLARNARPDDAEKAANLLWASGIVMRGVLDHSQQKRSYALALGHFSGLRRKTEGEVIDSSRFITDVSTALNQLHQADFPVLLKGSGDNRARQSRAVSTDLIADRLLVMATDNLSGDPFLRDAFTRGLERIGPAGVEAVVQAVAGKDEDRKNAALFILQGWRGLEGLSALLSEATTSASIPPDARAGLFKALRELGPAVPPEPIARWLATNKAEPGPRIEAIKVLTAMGPRAMLAVSPIVPGLLLDEESPIRLAALRLASVARSPESKAALVDLIGRADRPSEERRLAVSAVRGYDDKTLVTTFANALPSASEPALKGELLRALMALDQAKGTEAATALLNDPSRETRAEAIAALGSKLESALTVVRLYNNGKLPRDDFPRVLEAARNHKSPELSLLVAELLRSRLLTAPDLQEAKTLEDQVRRLGNPGRGKAVYLDASKGNCASCHRMEGTGGAVGPDLTKVWETLSFAKRAESILAPSKEIKEGYATFKVAAKDGRVATGLLLADTPEGVALRDAQGREVRIPASDVEEKGFDKLSLMPEGVVANLSFAELADLLAFLGDRPAQESLRPPSPTKP